MGSLKKCFKKNGFSSAEAAIVLRAIADYTGSGFSAKAATERAIMDQIAELREERAGIMRQAHEQAERMEVTPAANAVVADEGSGSVTLNQPAVPPGRSGDGTVETATKAWRRGIALMVNSTRDDFEVRVQAPTILRTLEVAQDIRLSRFRAKEIANKHEDVLDIIPDLPALLADPLYVYKRENKEHAVPEISVVLKAVTEKGEPIIVGFRDGELRTITPRHDWSGRTGKQNLLYEIANLKKPESWLYARDDKALTEVKALRASRRDAVFFRSEPREAPGPGRKHKVLTRRDFVKLLGKDTFYQGVAKESGEKRGSITFTPDGDSIIRLFEDRDLSTLLHEAGHFFLEVNSRIMAEADIVPEDMRRDWETTLKWLGVESGDKITTEHHEKFARGFEAYLRSGKAPSFELREVFRRFKSWLVRIYRDVRQLDVKVSPEMAAVFDRMLATDEQIEAMRSNPLFRPDPGILDMLTAAERSDYIKRSERALESAKEKLLKKALRQKERETRAWWKAAREQAKREVEKQIHRQPVYRLMHFLRTGELLDPDDPDKSVIANERWKLDRKEVTRRYGEEFAKSLPAGTLSDNGFPMEVAADIFGFSSADHMLRTLARARPRAELVEELTDAAMLRQHGDILNDGSIEQEALEAVENADRAALIAQDLATLSRATGEPVATREQFRQRAAEILGAKKVDDALAPEQYYRAEVKAAKEAGRALARKDYAKAAEEKRRQLLNHYLFRQSRDARVAAQKSLKRFKKYLKPQTRGKVRMDEDYRQQIVGLLSKYNLAPRLSAGKREKLTAAALKDWQAKKTEDDGAEFITPPEILAADTKTHYRDLTLDEFQAIADTADNIAAQGTLLRTILIEGKRIEVAEIAGNLADTVRTNLVSVDRRFTPRTPWEGAKEFFQDFLFNTLKARTFIRMMDGFKDLGPVHDMLMKPVDAAEIAKVRRMRLVAEDVRGMRGMVNDLGDSIYIPEIGASLNREQILAFALNWGNSDNRTKLLEGKELSEAQGRAVIANLTANDWKFVEAVWTYVDSFWPEIAKLEKERTGLVPAKVEAAPFTITSSDGQAMTLKGGYYPLKYDGRLSSAVESFDAKSIADLAKTGQFSRAQTKRGHAMTRVQGVNKPVRLDIGVFFEHLNQVVTDLTMGQALENTYRILQHPKLKKAIEDTLGVGATRHLDFWIKDVSVGHMQALSAFGRAAEGARAGVSVSVMGFKVSTTMVQLTGFTQAIVRIGPKYALMGLAKLLAYGNPMQINRNVQWAFDTSKLLRERSTTFHRDIFDALRYMQKKGQIRGAIAKAAFWPIVKAQIIVDTATWMGAYQKGLRDFDGSESKAVEFADMALIQAQGSGMMKDLSGIERGTTDMGTRLSPFVRLYTSFYSYFNTKLNLAYERTKETKFTKPRDVARLAGDYLLLFWVEAALGELLLDRLPDFDDEEEDGPLLWSLKLALINAAGTLPVMREISGGWQGFNASPAGLRGLEEIAGALRAVGSAADDWADDDEVEWGKVVRSLNSAAGIVIGYPGASQLNQILRAMEAQARGEEVGIMDFIRYNPN